jgi:hypothetical protein
MRRIKFLAIVFGIVAFLFLISGSATTSARKKSKSSLYSLSGIPLGEYSDVLVRYYDSSAIPKGTVPGFEYDPHFRLLEGGRFHITGPGTPTEQKGKLGWYMKENVRVNVRFGVLCQLRAIVEFPKAWDIGISEVPQELSMLPVAASKEKAAPDDPYTTWAYIETDRLIIQRLALIVSPDLRLAAILPPGQ